MTELPNLRFLRSVVADSRAATRGGPAVTPIAMNAQEQAAPTFRASAEPLRSQVVGSDGAGEAIAPTISGASAKASGQTIPPAATAQSAARLHLSAETTTDLPARTEAPIVDPPPLVAAAREALSAVQRPPAPRRDAPSPVDAASPVEAPSPGADVQKPPADAAMAAGEVRHGRRDARPARPISAAAVVDRTPQQQAAADAPKAAEGADAAAPLRPMRSAGALTEPAAETRADTPPNVAAAAPSANEPRQEAPSVSKRPAPAAPPRQAASHDPAAATPARPAPSIRIGRVDVVVVMEAPPSAAAAVAHVRPVRDPASVGFRRRF